MSRRRGARVPRPTVQARPFGPVARRFRALHLGETGSRLFGPLAVGLVLAALVLAALRVDIIRMRYQKATALERETALREEHADLVVSVGRLRHPERLAQLAAELGFAPPTEMIWLPERPAVGTAPPEASGRVARAGRPEVSDRAADAVVDRVAATSDAGALR